MREEKRSVKKRKRESEVRIEVKGETISVKKRDEM